MGSDFCFACELWQNHFGQLLAQFHTYLVEAVYIPDDALGKYFVFIKGNERAQGFRVKLPEHKRVRRFIPLKSSGRNKFFKLFT